MKKRRISVSAAAILTAAALYGCAGSSAPVSSEVQQEETVAKVQDAGQQAASNEQETAESVAAADTDTQESLAVIEDEAVPLYQKPAGSDVRTPVASGTVTYGNGRATIDASNTSKGYVMIKYTGGQSRIKIQIAKSTTYTYDLNARDAYEVFPFTEGSGAYSIKIFENVAATSTPRYSARMLR